MKVLLARKDITLSSISTTGFEPVSPAESSQCLDDTVAASVLTA